jgi:hypothetical protein
MTPFQLIVIYSNNTATWLTRFWELPGHMVGPRAEPPLPAITPLHHSLSLSFHLSLLRLSRACLGFHRRAPVGGGGPPTRGAAAPVRACGIPGSDPRWRRAAAAPDGGARQRRSPISSRHPLARKLPGGGFPAATTQGEASSYSSSLVQRRVPPPFLSLGLVCSISPPSLSRVPPDPAIHPLSRRFIVRSNDLTHT